MLRSPGDSSTLIVLHCAHCSICGWSATRSTWPEAVALADAHADACAILRSPRHVAASTVGPMRRLQ